MSSDKLASIKEPVVAVDFDIVESGKDRNVSVELTKEELNSLISSLEAANKVSIRWYDDLVYCLHWYLLG